MTELQRITEELENLLEEKEPKFKVGDFVYSELNLHIDDKGECRYGIVKEVFPNDNGATNYTVEFKYSEMGLPCEIKEFPINETKLEDGYAHINFAIAMAKEKIQNLEFLRG